MANAMRGCSRRVVPNSAIPGGTSYDAQITAYGQYWGQTLRGIHDGRSGDAEVLAHRREKQARGEADESLAAPGEPQSDALRADRDRRASAPWVRSRRRERGVLEPAPAGAAQGD